MPAKDGSTFGHAASWSARCGPRSMGGNGLSSCMSLHIWLTVATSIA